LSADFTTIEWLVPSIHGYFHRKHKYVQDMAGKEYEDPLIVACHKEICTKFGKKSNSAEHKNPHLLLHMKRLKLPNGITANNAKFNPGKEGTNELHMRVHRADVCKEVEVKDPTDPTKTKTLKVDQSYFYGVVSFLVNGSKVQLKEERTAHSEEEQFRALFGGKVTFAD
jgi:hypothetical protein